MMIAYIDPGSGALMLQMLIAAVVSGLVFFRQKVVSFFRLFKGGKDKEEPGKKE